MGKKAELIDQAIINCNEAVKTLTQGQYIAFCSMMVENVRLLAVLKDMIAREEKQREDAGNERNNQDT